MVSVNPDIIKAACIELAERNENLAKAYQLLGVPQWRAREAGYPSLASIIAYQQISTKAATAIWERVAARLGAITPQAVLECPEADLRDCGLSRPKIRHLTSIAQAIISGILDIDGLTHMEDMDAKAHLIAVKGIGPWTANIYLMSAEGRLDCFPEGDLGLIESYRMLEDTSERHTLKAFDKLAEAWRPYRGVAAHLLWNYINHMRATRHNS